MKKSKKEESVFNKFKNYFSFIAQKVAMIVGSAWCFILAAIVVLGWFIAGPILNFSQSWQLSINTITTIITFLMVFILQNTQNRDTEILNLKLDDLIRADNKAHVYSIKLNQLTDDELKQLEKEYNKLRGKKPEPKKSK